ncbi:hypothetical protein C5610_10790 [Idiomarina sp. OT37-5b]|uniref:hypothetical protein n=1 Tax=Idiomarina sp. OT37-5b TaxID=2100422 RepID=UPI000CFA160E|nr:hypothetical protein [Idiomarina sp. OT37-5b]AVJ56725.1 hypothetical protein C5610_10790 [Idiomarina sp. OT37-5b]
MCIVIDVNALPSVFEATSKNHEEFKPVKDWILSGRGYMVLGGSGLKDELAKMRSYLKLIKRLKQKGHVVNIDDDQVDQQQKVVARKTQGTGCDDQHLIALLGVSRCDLFCSSDARCYPFIKDSSLYPKNARNVKIYSGARNKELLQGRRVEELSYVI